MNPGPCVCELGGSCVCELGIHQIMHFTLAIIFCTGMLEKVEVRQLIQGIPIAITVLVQSPVTWSDDNIIAVVTQLGTYIFVSTVTFLGFLMTILYGTL